MEQEKQGLGNISKFLGLSKNSLGEVKPFLGMSKEDLGQEKYNLDKEKLNFPIGKRLLAWEKRRMG